MKGEVTGTLFFHFPDSVEGDDHIAPNTAELPGIQESLQLFQGETAKILFFFESMKKNVFMFCFKIENFCRIKKTDDPFLSGRQGKNRPPFRGQFFSLVP